MNVITVTSTADKGNGTLRAAIAAASAGDTIKFANTLASKTIKLTSGQLFIGKDLTIDGGNAPGLTVSGNNTSRVFQIGREKEATLKNLTIANGKTLGPGGGIRTSHESTLNLENVRVNNNVSELGGGIRIGHLAKANIINSSFNGNDGTLTNKYAGFSAGAISHDESRGQIIIKGSSFKDNQGFNGGAIYGRSTVRFIVEDSTFRDNVAKNRGGGGAIFTDGVSSLNYSGPVNDGKITIRGSVFDGNRAEGQGGALFLWGYGQDKAIIEDTILTDNTVTLNGQGNAKGGALWAKMGLNVRNVVFANNTATQQGGALWLESSLPANIVNSTFSGNTVLNDAGGAMFLNNYSNPVNITNSTIAYNSAGRANGGLWYSKNHAVKLTNSILANNTAVKDPRQNQAGFQAIDGGGNLEFSPDSRSMRILPNSLFAHPRLGALQTIGGTLVHPLKSESPAINAGIQSKAPATDQRGIQRDGSADIGAFERVSTSAPDTTGGTKDNTSKTIGEYGELSLDHRWKTITLDKSYTNPVVIVSDPTYAGSDPAAVRLRSVKSGTFQIRLQEPNYKDGSHTNEFVSYLVLEAGDWTLADGTRVSAGTRNSSKLTSGGFETIALNGFDSTPTVLSQVQTFNGGDWVTTRTKGQSSSRFQLSMQEEEALNNGGHAEERIGWLAIDRGRASDGDTLLQGGTTSASYDHTRDTISLNAGFDSAPSVIAKLSSFNGKDTAMLRLDDIMRTSFGARVQEDQSLDMETSHINESVSFLALEGSSGTLTGLAA